MATMTIGGMARAADVGVETIRFYERSGLLAPPPRTAAGHRRYGPDAVRRVRFIKRVQRLGFSLAEASELLALRAEAVPCPEAERRARAKVAEIEERIADLTATKAALLDLVADCGTEGATACPVLRDGGLPRSAEAPPRAPDHREDPAASDQGVPVPTAEQRPTLYRQAGCAESEQVRAWLTERGIRFVERDAGGDPAAAAALLATGVFATPLLVLGEETVFGFRPSALSAVLTGVPAAE